MSEKKMYVTINGKEYKLPNIDFTAMCELEDRGFSVTEFTKKLLSSTAILVGYTANVSNDKAKEMLNNEVKEKGIDGFSNISQVLIEHLAQSDFFMAKTIKSDAMITD